MGVRVGRPRQLHHWNRHRSACRELLLRRHRPSPRGFRGILVVSLVSLLVAVTATKLLPAVTLKSSWLTLHQFASVNVDTDVLAGATLAGGYVQDALDELARQRDSVRAERDAFHEFADDVQSLSTATQSTTGANTTHVVDAGRGGQELDRVRDSYRETVMALPDYEEEYGETFEEHLTAEFGPDVASVVIGGREFTDPVKQLLVQQARESARQREQLLSEFSMEATSLREARRRLDDVDGALSAPGASGLRGRSFRDLVEADGDIRQAETDCEHLIEDRQGDVHRINRQYTGPEQPLLQEYLYADLDVTFPVLAAALERIRELRERRSAVIREVVERD